MTISREDWQIELTNVIKTSLPRLKQFGINSGYTIIAASAILPVVAAGGDWVTALATMVGGIGANLISNLVQGAKNDIDVANRLQSAPPDDKVHQYIEELLEKLDAFNIVRQSLPESDWERLERLLDRKFFEYGNLSIRQSTTSNAPYITQKINRPQAKSIAFQALKRTWWVKKEQQKSEVNLHTWPMAFYDAHYLVNYEDKIIEEDKDKDGNVINRRTVPLRDTSPSSVELVILPRVATKRGENILAEQAYSAINGFTLGFEPDWGDNFFAKKSFDWLCNGALCWINNFLRIFGINTIRKQLAYFGARYFDYQTKPGFLPISLESILEDARHLAKKTLIGRWRTSTRSVLGLEIGQEDIQVVQYPFWVVDMTQSSETWIIVIDAVDGKVIFIKAPANIMAQIMTSLIGFFVIGIILTIVGFFVYEFVHIYSF
jgi:hypothetical protein